jgi:protein associated with RNAse G/E
MEGIRVRNIELTTLNYLINELDQKTWHENNIKIEEWKSQRKYNLISVLQNNAAKFRV